MSTQEKSPAAENRLKEHLFGMWEQAMLEIGFMAPDMTQHMMLGFRRIFGRGQFTEDDVHILMGVARQARWCAGERRRLEALVQTRGAQTP